MLCVSRCLSAQSGYLSYHSLPVSLNQSGHSLLTSAINKMFLSAELPLHENPWRLSDLKILRSACLAPTTKPPRLNFFLILMGEQAPDLYLHDFY